MPIKLRGYQSDIVSQTREAFSKGIKRVLIQLPTGGGKTAIASDMITKANAKGNCVFFICNRQELVDQTARSFYQNGVPFSYIAAGYNYDERKNVFICSIQALNRRLQSIRKFPSMIYWDECRGIAAKTWANVFHNFHDKYHIGLDATPCRLSGEPLGDFFEYMVKGPSVSWLIKNGYLCDYKIFAPKVADFSGVKTKMGDYSGAEIDSIMNNKKIIGNAVSEYKKHALGKRNLVFATSIDHSKNLCAEFNFHGINAESIDGSMDDAQRRAILKRFEDGKTLVLTSVDLVTAGFDLPAIECVTLERPTKSIALAKQMIGRGLRVSKNKEKLIILDHVNMWITHGLPEDEIDWSLDGFKSGPKKKSELSVKQCEKCYFVFPSIQRACPECGHEKPVVQRTADVEHTNDELTEIDKDAIRASSRKEQGQAQSQEDLYRLGIKRGYTESNARAWAKHVFNARQAKKLRGL